MRTIYTTRAGGLASCKVDEELVDIRDAARWRVALAEVPHAYWHTWECCSAIALTHGLPTYLYAARLGDTRLVVPFLERQWDASVDICTPAGFSGFATRGADLGAVVRHWHEFARSRGYVCGYFAQHPALPTPEGLGEAKVWNETFHFDLRLGADALLQRMRPNRRNAIHRWIGGGRACIRDRVALTEFLLLHHRAFLERAGASAVSFYAPQTLREICNHPAVELVGASDEQGVCAVCVFASTPWGAEALFNVATRDGRDHAVPLIWWGVEHYAARGTPHLHLGGGIRRGDTLAEAKRRYGTTVADFISLRQVYDPVAYASLCDAARVDSATDSAYFPPYRARPAAPATTIRA